MPELGTGSDSNNSKEKDDANFAEEVIRILGEIPNEWSDAAEVAQEDSCKQGAPGEAKFEWSREVREGDGNATEHETKGNPDEDGDDPGKVEVVHGITEFGGYTV